MLGGDFRPAAAKLELAERGMIEGIVGQAIRIGDGADLLEPALGTFTLRDGDGSVERHHRGRAKGQQPVVEFNDHSPICLAGARRGGVYPGNGRLEVIFGELGTGGRKLEQTFSLCHEPRVPAGAILIQQRAQLARGVHASGQARRWSDMSAESA